MDYIVSFIIFSMFWELSTCIECYKCDPEKSTYVDENLLCANFNYSDVFKANCEYSTICVKKVTSLTLENGMTTTSVFRDCAPQLLSGDQEKRNGKWYPVKRIFEEYTEGCTEPNDSDKVTKTTICYCRGSLCNTASSIAKNILFVIAGTTILLFYF